MSLINYSPDVEKSALLERVILGMSKEVEPNSRWRADFTFPDEFLFGNDRYDYFESGISDLYIRATRQVARMSIGVRGYIATKYFLTVSRGDIYLKSHVISLSFECIIIPERTYEIYVPEFFYDTVSNEYREWKCGYCGVPNPMEHRVCDKCGAARALLIQEM